MENEKGEQENGETESTIEQTIVKQIKEKTETFLKANLQPPAISQMITWGLKANPNKLMVSAIASKIRESLPTVTASQSDKRRTSKRKAGGVFRSPGKAF